MKQPQTDKRLTTLISIGAFVLSAAVGIAIPGLYFLINYTGRAGAIDELSEIHASLVSNVINKNPVMWRFEDHQLMTLVEHSAHQEKYQASYSILDAGRNVIVASAGDALARPIVSHDVALFDSAEPIGYYHVEWSLRELLIETLLVAVGALVFALILAIPLRMLPLRAVRQSQQRLVHMAHHDALTGLPNRLLMADRLKQGILNAQRYDRFITLVLIDLDNFKTINDGLGHDVGDQLLKQTAERLQRVVRRTDTVVRLGGDEFVVVLFDQPEQAESTTGMLDKIRDCIAEPLSINNHMLWVTCSMGLATYPYDGLDVTTLLKNADTAMYRAKELGRDNFQFFTPEMNRRLQERIFLQQGLLQALANDEFALVYQPQIESKSGEIVGVEALLRWNQPEQGLISPSIFIPIAEATGMIVPIGEWVLRTACKQNKAWQDLGIAPIKMSVNVSARQFREKNWLSSVAATLSESAMEAQYLELEITESLIMENVERAIATMKDVQGMGVQLSIDDFGTGYSSLSALKHFPVARLKIDQSFVSSLPENEDDKAIVMAVIALGHRLDLTIVAEGVETAQQQTFLIDNDCDEMQGYYFSKPVPAKELERLLLRVAPLSPRASAA